MIPNPDPVDSPVVPPPLYACTSPGAAPKCASADSRIDPVARAEAAIQRSLIGWN